MNKHPVGLKESKEPSGRALYVDLKARIRGGDLKPGDRIVNSRVLMDRFGISYHAVMLAMRRLEHEGYVRRKPGSGTYVTGLPDHVNLGAHTRTVRVISSAAGVRELFLRPLVETLQQELTTMECTHSLLTCSQERIAEFLVPGEADAFVWVCPSFEPDSYPVLPGVPIVLVAHDLVLSWPQQTGCDIVTADHLQGGTVAGAYLKEVGCERPVVVGVRYEGIGRMSPSTAPRLEGFQCGWGATLPKERVLLAARYTPAAGAETGSAILEMNPLPDAIFATSDELAAGICHALISHGVYPGKDIRVIGFDGQPAYWPEDPALTTIAVPLEKLGKAAASMAVQRAREPRELSRRLHLACSPRQRATG